MHRDVWRIDPTTLEAMATIDVGAPIRGMASGAGRIRLTTPRRCSSRSIPVLTGSSPRLASWRSRTGEAPPESWGIGDSTGRIEEGAGSGESHCVPAYREVQTEQARRAGCDAAISRRRPTRTRRPSPFRSLGPTMA